MRAHEVTDIMAISEQASAEEPRLICVIRDLTSEWQHCAPRTVTLTTSHTIHDLLTHISKDYGYMLGSFAVNCEANGTEQTLTGSEKLTLGELLPSGGNRRKNNFSIVQVEDGKSPVKIKVESGGVAFDDTSIHASFESSVSLRDSEDKLHNSALPSYSPATERNLPHTSQTSHKYPRGVCGLVNQAMTCYLNSLLQTLFMTPEFRNALYRWRYEPDRASSPARCIPYQLQRLFLQMQMGDGRAVETTDVTRSFGWDSSEAWQQHDVQELCRVMFDALEQKLRNTDQADLINHLYQGKLKDYVKCLECNSESARVDAYLDIPLVIKPFGAVRAYTSVEEALHAFVEPEILSGNNQYQCEKCNKKCDAHKGLKFLSFPYLLTLQLKRFDFDYSTMHRIKLNDRMSFPETLDLNDLIDRYDPADVGNNSQQSVVESSEGSAIQSEADQPSKDPLRDPLIDNDNSNCEEQDRHKSEITGNEGEAILAKLNQGEAILTKPNNKDYEYELFSIMIHSGSALGGHYYAYIKCFTDGLWYSFNDQIVSRVSQEDIRKTYGGSGSRSLLSGTYASSTNAYMLMYRKTDRQTHGDTNANTKFMDEVDFPVHIKELIQHMQEEKELNKRQREKERNTCKVRTFCREASTGRLAWKTLEVHKDVTLHEATDMAYKLFEAEAGTSRDCVRLVKYDEGNESIEQSYGEDSLQQPISYILGGVKTTYRFDLLLETKSCEEQWQTYRRGGSTLKVHIVDLKAFQVSQPIGLRVYSDSSLSDIRRLLSQQLKVPEDPMRLVLERGYEEVTFLTNADVTLEELSWYRDKKLYVDADPSEDCNVAFEDSLLNKLIRLHQNTIKVVISIPCSKDIQNLKEKEKNRQQLPELVDYDFDEEAEHNAGNLSSHSPRRSYNENVGGLTDEGYQAHSSVAAQDIISLPNGSPAMESESDSPVDAPESELCDKSNSAFHINGPGHPDLDLEDIRPLSGGFCDQVAAVGAAGSETLGDDDDDAADADDYDVTGLRPLRSAIGSPVVDPNLSPIKQYEDTNDNQELERIDDECSRADPEQCCTAAVNGLPCADCLPSLVFLEETADESGKQQILRVALDKRITVGKLKELLQPRLDVPLNCFKLYKVYSNSQEFECTRMTDTLDTMTDDSKMCVKLGHVLRRGEYKVKLFELILNQHSTELSKVLFDIIVAKGMTVDQAKRMIKEELEVDHGRLVPLDRIRMRKKSWKNPGCVYSEGMRFDSDISMYNNCEMFVQILGEPETHRGQDDLAIFVQRWYPSKFEMGKMVEVVLPSTSDINDLKRKLSDLSGVPEARIEIAKAKGTFPCEISVFDAHTGLDWNPRVSTLTSWPLYISDDGCVIIYRDGGEQLSDLTADRRKEINVSEAAIFNRTATHWSSSPKKEKALKIYTEENAADLTGSADIPQASRIAAPTTDLD